MRRIAPSEATCLRWEMRTSTWMCAAIAIGACQRQPRPKPPAATPIGNGQHLITVSTNEGDASAYRYAYSQANLTCPGGYEVVDSRIGSSRGSSTRCGTAFGVVRCKSKQEAPDLILVVRCSPSRSADGVSGPAGGGLPSASETSIPADEREERWWCFASQDVTLGACEPSRGSCERLRGRVVAPEGLASQVSACEHREQAVCFWEHVIPPDRDVLMCAPTIALCRESRAAALSKMATADDVRVKSDCFASPP